MKSNYYKFEVTVPSKHIEQVKKSISEAGGGILGNYDSCIWMTKGIGQFRPLKGSSPFIGQENKIETVEEYKIETFVEKKNISKVIEAMKKSHPYEVPSFQYWECYIE